MVKAEFTTSRTDTIRIYPSSNIYHRVWIRIEEGFDVDKIASTELSVYDCEILISVLKRAKKWLEER